MANNLSPRQVRLIFCDVFEKINRREVLSPFESKVAQVIDAYPDRHSLLAARKGLDQVYAVDDNPYLILSLHLAVIEQIEHDKPFGVRALYEEQLYNTSQLQAQKRMANVLGRIMHQMMSQTQDGILDQMYLEGLKQEFQGK